MKKILLFGAIAICSTLFAQTAEFKTADFIKKEKGKAIVITLEGQEVSMKQYRWFQMRSEGPEQVCKIRINL